MHTKLKKGLFLIKANQSKLKKDQFKPYYSCHFIITMVLPICSGYTDSPIHVNYKDTHYIKTTYGK